MFRDDDQEIEIAAGSGLPRRGRSEQDNPQRLSQTDHLINDLPDVGLEFIGCHAGNIAGTEGNAKGMTNRFRARRLCCALRLLATALAAALALGVLPVRAEPLGTWAWKMPVTFTADSRIGTLTNFPVRIALSTNMAGFRYDDFAYPPMARTCASATAGRRPT